jgi:hypothetical protein
MNIRPAMALGALLAVLAWSSSASAVIITSGPEAPIPAYAGTGLIGRYYGQPGESSNAGDTAYIASHAPLGTFLAANLQTGYSANDTQSLSTFLGSDAASFTPTSVLTGAATLNGQVISFSG